MAFELSLSLCQISFAQATREATAGIVKTENGLDEALMKTLSLLAGGKRAQALRSEQLLNCMTGEDGSLAALARAECSAVVLPGATPRMRIHP